MPTRPGWPASRRATTLAGAFLLVRVHRSIGVPDQVVERLRMRWIVGRDSDARGQRITGLARIVVGLERRTDIVQHDMLEIGRARAGHEHEELVAAVAADRVRLAE